MKKIALLVSPIAKMAYFKHYIDVAKAELSYVNGCTDISNFAIGDLDFLSIECEESKIQALTRLSFVMGIFEYDTVLTPLDLRAEYCLHEDFVFGSKYKGKTNEILTQQLLNVGLASIDEKDFSKIKLLDPMCGRATTLSWAMRFGIQSKGIEKDTKALPDIKQHTKKWCKLHRQKHSFKEGFVNKSNRKQSGKFIEFATDSARMQVISGDAREADTLLRSEKFHLLISDIPYGIQHTTQDGMRNPLETLKECAPSWRKVLKPGGALVLSFNKYIPKREVLIEAFEEAGLKPLDYEAPHRMSESIVRDIVIFQNA